MIPGLIHKKEQPFSYCKTIPKMIEDFNHNTIKSFQEYDFCNEECNISHIKQYLILLSKSKTHEFVDFAYENLKSTEPLIRFHCLKILIKSSKKIDILLYLQDSFYRIRALMLKIILTREDKIRFYDSIVLLTNDENFEVKKMALKNLLSFQNKTVKERVCKIIRDKHEKLRIMAAKTLRKLILNCTKDFFSKNTNGVFIYGLEDESYKVRIETIKSIYYLCDEKSKDEAFDFLSYLLNDDKEKVRLLASQALKKLSKNFLWKIPLENLNLLISNFNEKNRKISNNLLFLCGKLLYSIDTFFVYKNLLAKIVYGKDLKNIYFCIKNLVKNNLDLFFTNVNDFLCDSFLDERMKLANMIVLNELNSSGYDINMPMYVENELKFLQVKFYTSKKTENVFFEPSRTIFVLFLKNLENYKNFKKYFIKNGYVGVYTQFFATLYKATLSTTKKEDFSYINKALFSFGINNSVKSLLELKTLVRNLKIEELKDIFFFVKIPQQQFFLGHPLDILVNVTFSYCKGFYLRINDYETKDCVYYKIKNEIRVFLDVPSLENLWFCIVKKGVEDVLITKPEKLSNYVNTE